MAVEFDLEAAAVLRKGEENYWDWFTQRCHRHDWRWKRITHYRNFSSFSQRVSSSGNFFFNFWETFLSLSLSNVFSQQKIKNPNKICHILYLYTHVNDDDAQFFIIDVKIDLRKISRTLKFTHFLSLSLFYFNFSLITKEQNKIKEQQLNH